VLKNLLYLSVRIFWYGQLLFRALLQTKSVIHFDSRDLVSCNQCNYQVWRVIGNLFHFPIYRFSSNVWVSRKPSYIQCPFWGFGVCMPSCEKDAGKLSYFLYVTDTHLGNTLRNIEVLQLKKENFVNMLLIG
jgi:hypothetical protein